jgi:LPS sulfotransferase NodH
MVSRTQSPSPSRNPVIQNRAFIICTSPRCGSYLLCDAITSVDCLGRPNEYFRVDNGKFWSERLRIKDEAEYLEKVIAHGRSSNGVFGLKLHWFQVPDLLTRFRSANPTLGPEADLDECLRSRFETVDYFWLRRRDKVAQGISWFRALRSGVWSVRTNGKAAGTDTEIPKFDFAEIHRRIQLLEDYDKIWHELFARKTLRAIVLWYEDFVKDRQSYDETVRELCKYAGFTPDHLPICAPAYQRQGDPLSVQWRQEYHKMKAELDSAMAPPSKDRPHSQVTIIQERGDTVPMIDDPLGSSDAASPEKAAPAASDPPAAALPFVAYDVGSRLGVRIVSASQRRNWMDASNQGFAYSCLPLVIANQHGWFLLCPCRIKVVWNGTAALDAIAIEYPPNETRRFATSLFGEGIITFHMDYVFRTPPGVNLHARGPANMPKDGIAPLEGIVETDWAESSFTMNWKVTRPHHEVVFEENEPFAMITPTVRGELERYSPAIQPVAFNAELEAGFRAWSRSRDSFNENLKIDGSEARKSRRQRHYIRGTTITRRTADSHQTSLALHEFIDKRS